MPRPRLAFAFLACLSLVAVACEKGAPDTLPPSAASPVFESPMPDFKRRTLSGSEVDTAALHGESGQVVVVKFFAKYCEPCKRTLPAAQKLATEYPDVRWIGISEDEYATDAQALVEMFGLGFPVVHDQGNVLSGRFRVTEMPATFVVDRQGVVRWVGGPGQDERQLDAAIRFLRAG
jgi:thiol-disulfide isomerase/thioredoxin